MTTPSRFWTELLGPNGLDLESPGYQETLADVRANPYVKPKHKSKSSKPKSKSSKDAGRSPSQKRSGTR